MKLSDKAALVAEIEKLESRFQNDEEYADGYHYSLELVKRILDTIEGKEGNHPCEENRDKELALSLQIQGYLNTASDELYAKGKPLYSKLHNEGIHECMKMWKTLHDYYFYDSGESKAVDLEKEIEEQCTKVHQLAGKELRDFAKYFVELGIKAQKEQILAKAEKVEISCASFAPLSSGNYKAGDKLLIIKEEQL